MVIKTYMKNSNATREYKTPIQVKCSSSKFKQPGVILFMKVNMK